MKIKILNEYNSEVLPIYESWEVSLVKSFIRKSDVVLEGWSKTW